MSILGSNGLNSPIGAIGAQLQDQKNNNSRKSKEELAKWDASRLHISTEPKDFPDLIATMYADTQTLSMAINGVLSPIFSDYYGSKVEIVQNRQLYSTIFFSEDASKKALKDQFKAIEPVISKDQLNSADNRIAAFNHLASFGKRNMYKVTKEADEMLRDIIPDGAINKDNGNVDWNKIMQEGSFNQQGIWSSRTYVQISIDLGKMLKVMYGGISSDGGEWEYMVNVGAPINPVMTPLGDTRANKWQLFIMRCNSRDVKDMARSLGFAFGNDLNIITDC